MATKKTTSSKKTAKTTTKTLKGEERVSLRKSDLDAVLAALQKALHQSKPY